MPSKKKKANQRKATSKLANTTKAASIRTLSADDLSEAEVVVQPRQDDRVAGMDAIGEVIEVEYPDDPLSLLPRDAPSHSRERAPIVKITNTSRSDINGKFGYVQAYHRTGERYAVTLLEGEERHPALVYFGVLDADGPKNTSSENEGPQDKGQRQKHKNSTNRTLLLPPTALIRLDNLDSTILFLQYVALHILGWPRLARCTGKLIRLIHHQVMSVLRLETFVAFFLLILPVALMKTYNTLLVPWSTLSATDLARLNMPAVPLSSMVDLFSAHMGDLFMTALFLLGTGTIARFVIFEYRFLKNKAQAVRSFQAGSDQGMVRDFSITDMLRYRIDYHFSKSKWAKVVLLMSFTFMLIAVGAGMLMIFTDDSSVSNAVWISWTYVADPGTHADCPEAFLIRVVSFTITLGGMLIFALMIGIVSDYIAEKVDDLKKGKSQIIDTDHTVLLGWNDKSLSIIQQVALANESEGGGTIVVLANNDKADLEATTASAEASNENPLRLLGTEVIFRSGNPLLESELSRVSIKTARSIVLLSSEDLDPDEADATQVRQVMALKAFDESLGTHSCVVVEVQDVDNQELFNLIDPGFAEVVVTHDIIGRLMIQCARCPGLACVLEEMMGFEGSEFYFEEWPELTGMNFYDIICRFNDAVPIGVKSCKDGKVYINPKNDHIINEGDKVLVLAEDNDSYEVNDGNFKVSDIQTVPKRLAETKKVEKIMFCGWRRDMADMIVQLDEYVEEGSELWLLNLVPAVKRVDLLKDKGNKEDLRLKNLKVFNVVGNPVVRRDLKSVHAVDTDGRKTGDSITLDQLDSILILADEVAIEDGANMMSCDSRSLSSFLVIQDIQKKLYDENIKKFGKQGTRVPCTPISEILDSRTKNLLSVANCKGYIMSNQIISSVIAQVSEEKDINTVLHEILTAEGSETYIRSVCRYLDVEKENEMSFWEISLRARQYREVVVGFKPANLEFKQAAHLIINPPDKSVKRKWAPGDMIVTFGLD